MLPFAPALARQFLAGSAASARRTAVLPDRLRRASTVDVEPTPHDVVYRENEVRLRRYEPQGGATQPVPVVVAYAFVNTPAILDLSRDRSVVGQFLDRGFAVFVVDWGNPSARDARLTLADYVRRYLANCVDVARETAGADAVHLLGISTGSPLAAAYAGAFPEPVATLTLQGPPLDFHADGGMLDFRELVASVDARALGGDGNVPAPAIDLGFALREPVAFPVQQPVERWEHVEDAAYVERMARLARWTAAGRDVAGETYRSFVEDLVVENALIEGRLDLDGLAVDLENVDVPVGLILGEDDAYVPHAASLPFLEAIPSEDAEVFWFPTGHVGTLVGPPAHEDDGWPRVTAWLADRS